MSVTKMHNDEIDINTKLVQKLLANQFPNWANLKLQTIHPESTDNAMYKLGSDKIVRLPRTKRSAVNIKKEHLWLPKLAPILPISIPTPLSKGNPQAGYPFS
jgi:aminoglycoside phosphotransferase (APT) family kinase protein